MPCLDFKEKDDDQPGCAIYFSGDCKWSVNYETVDLVPYININSWSENEIDEQASNYVCYSLRAKSEALDCEILVYYWSEESGFDQFDHYNRGTVVKQRKIAYGGDPASFDWDKTEFIGHEGEYDENVDAEVLDAQFINLLTNAVNILEKPDSDDDVDDNDDETTVDLPKNTPAFSGDPNMFRWTFTSGKTAKTDDWTMSIPDGFKSIKPIDQDRAFTLVPESENSLSLEGYHISILPGGKNAALLADKEYWHPYPTARKGVSALLHAMFSEQIGGLSAKLMGVAAVGEIYATAWDDVSGIVEIFDTDDSSYSFQCQIDRGDGTYMLRIQTLSINDEQKYDLLDSVIKLLHTIKFNNPNTVCPQKFLIENEDVYLDLVKGKTTKFEEAIDQINAARNAVYNGQIKLMTLMAEYGTMDVTCKRGHDYIEQIHKDVIDVMDHCYKLVDKLISRLVDNKTVSVMPAVLEKLKELNPFEFVTHLEQRTISVPLTDDLKFIREKWTKLAKGYGIDFANEDHKVNGTSNTPSNSSKSSDVSKSSPNQKKAKPQTQKNYSKYNVDDSYETKCRNERERFEKECKELAEKIKSDNESNRNKELRKIEKDYDKE